jgi:hypothetical protein
MKWLNKLAEQGLIRKEIHEDILNDISIIKESMSTELGLNDILNKVASEIKGNKSSNKLVETLVKGRQKLISSFPEEDKEKAGARFDEIAKIAPTVAANEVLSSKLVHENLHSGISNDMATKLSLVQYNHGIKKVGSIRPEVLGDIVADIYLIKEAGFGSNAKDFMKHLALYSSIPLAVGTVGGAINWGASKLKEKKLQGELDRTFKEVLKGSSDTALSLRANPDGARNAYNTLVHFAPSVALNATAARGFVSKLMEYQDRVDVSDLKTLTDVQKNMSQIRSVGLLPSNPFTRGFSGTADTLGMSKALQASAAGAFKEFNHAMTHNLGDEPAAAEGEQQNSKNKMD